MKSREKFSREWTKHRRTPLGIRVLRVHLRLTLGLAEAESSPPESLARTLGLSAASMSSSPVSRQW